MKKNVSLILILALIIPVVSAYVVQSSFQLITQTIKNVEYPFYLIAESYDATRTDWSVTGTYPYLDAVDAVNYVSINNAALKVCGDFGFENTGLSGINTTEVLVQVYAKQQTAKSLSVYCWNGASWINIGEVALTTQYQWVSITATSTLSSTNKVDAAKIYFQCTSPAGTYIIDAVRIKVTL